MTTQTLFFNELDQPVAPEDAVKMVQLTVDDEGNITNSIIAYAEPDEIVTEIGTSKSGSWGHAGRPGKVGGQAPTTGKEDVIEDISSLPTTEGLSPIKLDSKSSTIISEYQDNSLEVNGYLREGPIGYAPPEIQKTVIQLDKIFKEKGITLEKDIILYRGLDAEEMPAGKLVSGEERAYLSTSINPKSAGFFGDTVMRIKVPKGTKMLPILTGEEAEVLLPRKLFLRVDKEIGKFSRKGSTIPVIDVLIIPEALITEGSSKSGYYNRPGTGRKGQVGGSVSDMRKLKDGEEYPEHLRGRILPGWKDVIFTEDKTAGLWARGVDSKGKYQYVYNPDLVKSNQDAKFSKVAELDETWDDVIKENASNYLKHPEESDCTKVIMETGLRPGSTKDTLADKQAYGITTLEGRHVVVDSSGNVSLQFVGKSGVDLDIPIEDSVSARMIANRAEQAGPTGKVFKTSSEKLLNYTHTLGGSGYNVKDIRTTVGTREAIKEIAKYPQPTNMQEYKALVKNVSTAVSKKLGNTPSVASKYYIAPWAWGSVQVIK